MKFTNVRLKLDYWDIDYNYYTNRDNCSCENICRCKTIENFVVNSVKKDDFSVEVLNGKKKQKLNEIEEYCVDRILTLNRFWNTELYSPNIQRGYYGEELYGIYFDNLDKAEQEIKTMLAFDSNIDKIFYVLNLEYAHIPTFLKEYNNVKIEQIKPWNIRSSQGQQDLIKRESHDLVEITEGIPQGIITEGDNKLIDGNHRWKQLSIENKPAKYIVLYKEET